MEWIIVGLVLISALAGLIVLSAVMLSAHASRQEEPGPERAPPTKEGEQPSRVRAQP